MLIQPFALSSRSMPFYPPPSLEDTLLSTTHNIILNNKTTLDTLFHYGQGAVLKYPDTSAKGAVSHLFELSLNNWTSLKSNFAYSQGAPTGRT